VDDTLGRHVELRTARWLTRFGNAARQAAEYIRGRVILAGDAAHIHPPAGAIGVNVALDDAFNLGWKLAATVRGAAPAHLLASYHTERHTAGAHVLANTQAQVLLGDADNRLDVHPPVPGRCTCCHSSRTARSRSTGEDRPEGCPPTGKARFR
jgi:2-polyprenyl-6-methoxyphenol hydroxylase-like FAD-dependent oxidoreductase